MVDPVVIALAGGTWVVGNVFLGGWVVWRTREDGRERTPILHDHPRDGSAQL